MVSLPTEVTGPVRSDFFGPVTILPLFFHKQFLHQKLQLPTQPEDLPSGPDLIAALESDSTGPRLTLFLHERSWLALALLNQDSHEHVASLLALLD